MRKKYLLILPAAVFFLAIAVSFAKDKIFYQTQIAVGRNEIPAAVVNLAEVQKLVSQVP